MSDKSSLRKELLRIRDSIAPEIRHEKSGCIRTALESIDEFRNAGAILIFVSFRSEVDTFGILSDCLFLGKRVIVPKVERKSKTLRLYEIQSPDELGPGYMGIPEPLDAVSRSGSVSSRRIRSVDDMDVVIIPGAGFDPDGNRIGYGGGYYDRLLSELRHHVPVIAPAFEEQVVESVPAEPHDIRVDVIVTEKRVIRCR